MTEQTLIDMLKTIGGLSWPTGIVGILYAGYKQWWVWGWQYRAMQTERDFWRATALRVTHLAEKSMEGGTTPP